ALAAEQAASEVIGRRITEPIHRIPEIRRTALVGNVAQHVPALAVLDLVEQLPAELEIKSLLVDAEAPVADDVDSVFDTGDEIVERCRLRIRLQRNVWHALDWKRRRVVGIGTAIRLVAADERCLADRHL